MKIDRQLSGPLAAGLFIVLIGATSLAGTGLLPEPGEFREEVDTWGVAGVGAACALATVHAVVPFPAELLSLATGYAYGFLPALVLMLVLWTGSCLVAFWLGRRFGRPLVERLVERRALVRAESTISGASTGTLLALRIIPIVPYNFVSYPSGMFGVPLGRFTWTTALGLAPQIAVVTYAGSEAVELSPTDLRIWVLGLGWLALILVGRWLGRRLGRAQ